MTKLTNILLAIGVAGVPLIAGIMVKDQWERYQLRQAQERHSKMESFREGCFDESPASQEMIKFRLRLCRFYGAMLIGDETVKELEQELAAERKPEDR